MITTEKERLRAMTRIDVLMDAKPGTPEADELVTLVELVEAYEEKRFPIEAPSPEDAARFREEQELAKQF